MLRKENLIEKKNITSYQILPTLNKQNRKLINKTKKHVNCKLKKRHLKMIILIIRKSNKRRKFYSQMYNAQNKKNTMELQSNNTTTKQNKIKRNQYLDFYVNFKMKPIDI